MSLVVDLNGDLGEGAGHDDKLLALVTSANIACGFHAGDSLVMGETVRRAKLNNVAIGAHPSLHDLWGFGRRVIQ